MSDDDGNVCNWATCDAQVIPESDFCASHDKLRDEAHNDLEAKIKEHEEFHFSDKIGKQRAEARIAAMQAGAFALPETLTLAEHLKRERPPVVWRIDQLWRKGHRVLLAAPRKAGKTTFLGNLIRSLADGDPFLGHYETQKIAGTIVLIDLEMDEDQGLEWLEAQKIENPDRIIPYFLRGHAGDFNIMNPEIRARWAGEIRERGGETILVDPLKPLIDVLGLDESREAGKLLTYFGELLREAGPEPGKACDGLVSHHMGHVAERERGDSSMGGWSDSNWRLLMEKDGDKQWDSSQPRSFTAFGRGVDQDPVALDYTPAGRRLTLSQNGIGGTVPRADIKAQRHRAAIVKYVTEHDGCSSKDLTTAGISNNPSRDGLTAMYADGTMHWTPGVGNAKHLHIGPNPAGPADAFDSVNGADGSEKGS
jgi:hypothetical protein